MMSEQNKAVIRHLVEDHWNRKDHSLVDELFAPAVAIHTPDGNFVGHDGASTLLAAYATAFPDFQITVDDLLGDGDKVTLRWTYAGTNRGALANIPATGKGVTVPGCIGVFKLSGGKVSEAHLCWDRYALHQQLGLL
jgi:steroid delta-isomerase-like uncharacterized protein